MKRSILVAGVLAVSAPAWGGPIERCGAGVAAEHQGDLTRAALYLDGCDEMTLPEPLAQDVARATHDLRKKLDASDVSVLEVISRPAGQEAQIDAIPGEHFTTPVTFYVAAGKHTVTVGAQTVTVETKPHARTPLYIEPPRVKSVTSPHDGKVDFNEDSGGEAGPDTAPPPDQKHPPLTPCKYSNSCTEAGAAIDDPLAEHASPPPPYPHHAIELRGGAAYDSALEPSLALAAFERLDRSTHPFVLGGRGGWNQRGLTATASLAKVVAATDTAWLSVGAGPTYDSYNGPGASALVDLSLRRLPVTLGAQYEQAFVHTMGTLPHVLTLELGIGWRGR